MRATGESDLARVIRVLLADIHGLLAGVVREAIMTQSDIAIVGEVHEAERLSAALANDDIDVVLMSFSGMHVPFECQALLFRFPQVALVAIKADGRRAEVYTRKVVREISSDQLVEVIREAAKDRERPTAAKKPN